MNTPRSDREFVVRIDPDIMDLVPDFLANRKNDVQSMRQALTGMDFEAVGRIGHSIKGAGGGFGFDRISELGRDIERAARDRNADLLRSGIDALAHYLENVKTMTNQSKPTSRVLIIDDSPDLRNLLSMGLGKAGYETVEAENGIAAQDSVRDDGPFDVLILDLQMPLMDGFRYLKWLRNEARNPVPVLVFCSLGPDDSGTELAARAAAAGANAVLFKPARLPVLIEKLSEVLSSART